MKRKRPSYIPENQWIEDLVSHVYHLAHEYLPLQQWNFSESYRDEKSLIFDSEYCRMKLLACWDADMPWVGDYEVSIYYGRLHAPNQGFEMVWQDQRCNCWLDLSWDYVLEYINHIFPAVRRPLRKDIFREFLEKRREFPSRIHWRLAVEAEVWRWYTPHLFELFDLRRPELWEGYRTWLKERYEAENQNEEDDEQKGFMPYYRVC